MTLEGRVALITGASQGIGQAIAIRLAAAGASVALAARNQDKLNEGVQQITSAGGKASAFQLDVADEEQIKSVFKAVIAQLGKIDILVNNAGITRDQLVMRGVPDDRAARDLHSAVEFLKSQSDVNKDRIGAIGWCMIFTGVRHFRH